MSNLTELLPAGGSGKTVDFVASGTLPNGKPVILKADGTVEVVAESSTTIAESIPAGSGAVFNSGTTSEISISFDPNNSNTFVVAYRDEGNSEYGAAAVGTISGTSISFGAEYIFYSAISTNATVSFDHNTANTFVITYRAYTNAEYGTAVVGVVSGTSISYGTSVVFNAARTLFPAVAYDPNTANKVVVVYRDQGNLGYGTTIVGTVSGTSITFGSEYVFTTSGPDDMYISFDPNTAGKFVVAYEDDGDASKGKVVSGSVSGTTITFGSIYIFTTGSVSSGFIGVAYDPNTAGKFVIGYKDSLNFAYGTAVVGTVSGTVISLGSPAVFNSGGTYYTRISFDPSTTGKFVLTYQDSSDSAYGKVSVGTVSGTTLTFGSPITFYSNTSLRQDVSFDPNTAGKFVICYRDYGSLSYGTAIVGQMSVTTISTNLTANNFLGTSTEAYADTDPATILLQGGISTNQSGLTIGSDYYVQTDGTLATTADTISVKLGKALSATSILLSGE